MDDADGLVNSFGVRALRTAWLLVQQDSGSLQFGYWSIVAIAGMIAPVIFVLGAVGGLAAFAHLWGAQVERTRSTIVVKNGMFSRRQVFSTRDVEVGAARLDFVRLLKLGGTGQNLPRAIVLVDRVTGRRTTILASALATRNQRQQLWEQLTPRLAKVPYAYTSYQAF